MLVYNTSKSIGKYYKYQKLIYYMTLTNIVNFMGDLGVFSVIIPFVIIFTISFSILTKSKLFSRTQNEKGFNAMISMIISAHFIFSQSRVDVFNMIILAAVFSVLITFFIQLIISISNIENEFIKSEYVPIFVLIISFFSWVYLFGMFNLEFLYVFISWIWQFVLVFGVFIGLIFYITGINPFKKEEKNLEKEITEDELNNYNKRLWDEGNFSR